jgi:hypothetical protein
MDQVFNDSPLWAIALALLTGLMAARELGGWIARRRPQDPQDEATAHGYIVSGVLVLLALLLGFTFGLALDRYETRRDIVVAEANAIGTAEMRVRLLDAPHAANLVALYHDYAETRLRYGNATAFGKPAQQRASSALRDRIQAETLAAVQPIRTTPLAVLVVPAVNETLDIGAAREAANDARIPTSVIAVLVAYALIAAGVLGSALAGARRSHRSTTVLLFLLLTLAITMILDLDRPKRGTIRISQVPMERLVQGLRASPPPAAQPSSPDLAAAKP